MTLWMQNGYFTRLRKTAQCKCPSRNLLVRRSVRFGVVVDQFGIPWAINCEQAPSVA